MSTLKQLNNVFLLLIEVGGLARMIYCFNNSMANPDEAQSYLKKGKNLLIFMILANVVLSVAITVKNYVA